MKDDDKRKTPINMTPEEMQAALDEEAKKFETEQKAVDQKVEAEVADLLNQLTTPSSQSLPQQPTDENKSVDQLIDELLPAERQALKETEEQKREEESAALAQVEAEIQAGILKDEIKEEKGDMELENLMKDVFGDNTDKDKEAKAVKEMEDLLRDLTEFKDGKRSAEIKETPAVEQAVTVEAPQLVEQKPQEAVRVQQWVSAKPSKEAVEDTLHQARAENEKILDELDSVLDAAGQKLEADKLIDSLSEGQIAPQVAKTAEVPATVYIEIPTLKATVYTELPKSLDEQPLAPQPTQTPAVPATVYVEMPNADDKNINREATANELNKAKKDAKERLQELLDKGKQSEHRVIQKVAEKASSFMDRVISSRSESNKVER